MGKMTDIQIRAWVKNGENFEGRSDGDGLYLSFPKNYSSPMWKFRYRFAGKQRIMNMGSYASLSLAKAREAARELSARGALGYDVAGEKHLPLREIVADYSLRSLCCCRDGKRGVARTARLVAVRSPT